MVKYLLIMKFTTPFETQTRTGRRLAPLIIFLIKS